MQDYELSLKHLDPIDLPSGLFEKILKKIHLLHVRRLRIRLVFSFVGLGISGSYIVFNWHAILMEIQQSSFVMLVRLFFTDTDIALGNFRDLSIGLLEAIPLESLLLTLVAVFCVVAAVALVLTLSQERHSVAFNQLFSS